MGAKRRGLLHRVAALALAALLAASLFCGCAPGQAAADALASRLEAYVNSSQSAQADRQDEQEHACVDFSQMSYERPDLETLLDETEKLGSVSRGDDLQAVLDQCDRVDALYTTACTQYALLSVYQSLDVNDDFYYEESVWLYEALSDAERRINEQLTALLKGKFSRQLEQEWGEEYVQDVLLNSVLYDESAADLLNRENELSLQYDRIYADTSVEAYGRSWTLEELYEDNSLDYDRYFEVYDLYCRALCDNVSELFLELVDVRNEIARTLGFDSYAEYRYLCYTRDYTPQDAEEFAALVKQYIVPLYVRWSGVYGKDAQMLHFRTFEKEETLETLGAALARISPKLGGAFDYMRDYHLYDIDVYEGKSEGGYTTYFDDYASPFLFDNYDDDFSSVTGLIHELGHYASYYNNPGEGPLDLAEIDSQGLEMLMMADYPELFGNFAGAAAGDKLTDMMYSLVTGCMQDEFQRRVYGDGEMTMEEICTLYAELNDSYGLTQIYDASPYEWALISHTFQSPLYYVSYAVSAVPALEIWQIAREDYEVGRELYLSLYTRDHDEDFLAVLESLGFADPFEEETVASLARALDEEMARTQSRSWRFSSAQ